MRTKIKAYAAESKRQPLAAFEYDPGVLHPEWVEVKVEHCGLCHSDISMLDNAWQRTRYPLVPGHEIVGTVIEAGASVKRVATGDRVGIGWYAKSCLHCQCCLQGDHHLCSSARGLITDYRGGFAEKVRCHWLWATPLPREIDPASAGPLFCGGITVFGPIVNNNVRPTDKVGVVGIGGLGHLAIRFLKAWGCEVTAFTSRPNKADDILSLGAHRVVDAHDENTLAKLASQFDFILSTVNAPLPWQRYLDLLAPKGRLHMVGAVLEPIPVSAFSLIGGQKAISGSPLANPALLNKMLQFCARHGIAPLVEHYPMSKINEAVAALRAGKARYRIVLDADFRR